MKPFNGNFVELINRCHAINALLLAKYVDITGAM